MDITKATFQHIDAIAPLFDAYRVFYGQKSDLPAAYEFIESRIKNEESVIFIAWAHNEGSNNAGDDTLLKNGHQPALGFTQLYPSFSSVSAARTWLLNDLFVAEHARRQGVATQLMNAAKALAEHDKVKGISLATAENNANAQPLYEGLGYQQITGMRHYFLPV